MIDFEHVWLPQIMRYAKLISSGRLDDEWLGRTAASTSITDPDELQEQVFDDLDAERIWADNRDHPKLSPDAVEAIDSFLANLKVLAEAEAQLVVASETWARTKQAARAVVANVR